MSVIDEGMIPGAIKDEIDKYVMSGALPQSRFILSILENNLRKAIQNAADPKELQSIPAIITYLLTYHPTEAWGSPRTVEKWINHKGAWGRRPAHVSPGMDLD